MSRTDEKARANVSQVEKIAVEHLAGKKHWATGDYRLESKGTTKQGLAVVWAIYLDDEQQPVPGAGRSVILHIDSTERRIVDELAFQ